MPNRIIVALIHHPAYDKNGGIITTSVTNFDIHDISRSSRTYGVDKFFIVHPMKSQQIFARRIIQHWQDGYGSVYNETRREAFSIVEIASSFEEMLQQVEKEYGEPPVTIATSAKTNKNSFTYGQMREVLLTQQGVYVIVLGTGWGLPKDVISGCRYILEPVQKKSSYNHLSVRAAAAIILDRLLSND